MMSVYKKRLVSLYTKKCVAYIQKYLCAICNVLLPPEYEVDHKIPLFKGGSNDFSNLQALCPNCHRRKTMHEKEKPIAILSTKNIIDLKEFQFMTYDEYITRTDRIDTTIPPELPRRKTA
jgi:hypothetical protein